MKRNTQTKTNSQNGQAMIIAVLFFVVITALIVFGITSPLMRSIAEANSFSKSKQSFFVSEAGLEDVFYRIKTGMSFSITENVPIGNYVANVDINDLSGNRKEAISTGDVSDRIRKNRIIMDLGEGASFNFGVQTDVGGFLMENSSSVEGNVFSNGEINGSGNNLVNGDAISADSGGLVNGVHVAGDAHAHTIENSTIDGDAYYFASTTLINTTVSGTKYPGSSDEATSTLPITDEQIETWKSDAEAGGITTCTTTPYVIDKNTTIGPQKFQCDLEIRTNPNITFAGAIWVEGNLRIKNNPSFSIEQSLADNGESVPIVVDNESDRTLSSKIILENSGFFDGGDQGAYIMLLSQNNDSKNGGNEPAITVENGGQGDILLYSGQGEILLQNNVSLKEITAYKVHLQNSSKVTYESGLINLLFTSGPGASFSLDSWEEVE